ELDEERPEIFIQTRRNIEVHIGAAVIDPGDGAAIAEGLAHRSGHPRLFLSYADKDHSSLMLLFESAQSSLHHIVLALALFKSHQIDVVVERKLHDRCHKSVSHLCDLLGRGEASGTRATGRTFDVVGAVCAWARTGRIKVAAAKAQALPIWL